MRIMEKVVAGVAEGKDKKDILKKTKNKTDNIIRNINY